MISKIIFFKFQFRGMRGREPGANCRRNPRSVRDTYEAQNIFKDTDNVIMLPLHHFEESF